MDNKKSKKVIFKDIKDFFSTIFLSFIFVFLFVNFICRPVKVKGNSMYPTIKDNDYGFSNVLGTKISSLERFDIVTIYIEEKNEYLVKRIIGLPNETVMYKNNHLYINGEEIPEPFLNTEYAQNYTGLFTTDISSITLGEEEYYCLGDNRINSKDSRFYGPFKKKQIKSKGLIVLWPLSSFEILTW